MTTTGARARPRRRKPRQYLVDEKGQRTGIVLTLEEYDELIEAAEQREDIRHLEEGKKIKGKPALLEKFAARVSTKRRLVGQGVKAP